MFIFDAAIHQLIKQLNTGKSAACVLADDNGWPVFIGCTADNYVAVAEMKTLTVNAVRGVEDKYTKPVL